MEQTSLVVKPVLSVDEALQAFRDYQALADKIGTTEDFQIIQGTKYKKKSFWRKIQRIFNVSLVILKEDCIRNEKGFTYLFTVRATAPNGVICDGTGACSSTEKGLPKTEHNARAIAETRAKNRAISDLCGFGEVSADELDGDDEQPKNNQPKNEQLKPAPQQPPQKEPEVITRLKLMYKKVDHIDQTDIKETCMAFEAGKITLDNVINLEKSLKRKYEVVT